MRACNGYSSMLPGKGHDQQTLWPGTWKDASGCWLRLMTASKSGVAACALAACSPPDTALLLLSGSSAAAAKGLRLPVLNALRPPCLHDDPKFGCINGPVTGALFICIILETLRTGRKGTLLQHLQSLAEQSVGCSDQVPSWGPLRVVKSRSLTIRWRVIRSSLRP